MLDQVVNGPSGELRAFVQRAADYVLPACDLVVRQHSRVARAFLARALGRGLRRQWRRFARREVNLERLPQRRPRLLAELIERLPRRRPRLLAELIERLPQRRPRLLAELIERLPQRRPRLLAELVDRLLPRLRRVLGHDGRRSGNATTVSPDGGSSCSKPLRAISSAWCAINFA